MKRKYQRFDEKKIKALVKESTSMIQVLQKLGRKPVGGSHTNLTLQCKRRGIDTSHFTGQAHNKGKPAKHKKSAAEVLVCGTSLDRRTGPYKLRRALTESNILHACNKCGLTDSWNGEPLVLEIDHKDGQYWNNTLENLQYLCPNCHSQKT